MKISRISNFLIIFLILLLIPFSASSHVLHYKNLNNIKFDIYRNNKFIGNHMFSFKRSGTSLSVKSVINFQIKKLGVVLYKYYAEGVEKFVDDKLVKFTSKTKQNKKDKYVNLKLEENMYIIDGSSFKGEVADDHILGTWWNHSIIKAPAQISAVSGRIIKQNVEFLGKEKIKIGNKSYNALHFNFTSSDAKLSKNKRLNTHVWYDEETMNWIKASFNKKGNWEYRLVESN